MIGKTSLAALFVTASIVGFGCDFGPPPPPQTPLTQRQVEGVLECQETIKQEGQKFTAIKLAGLEKCLDGVLSVQLQFENGLIRQVEYNARLTSARRECLSLYRKIGKASTRLVGRIIHDCSDVESIILDPDYDPLQFGATGVNYNNVTELAGAVCGAKELAVDFAVAFEVPRMANLLDILDGDTTDSVSGTFSIEGPSGTEIPNIPLDERCNFSISTSSPTPAPTDTPTPTPTDTPIPTPTDTPTPTPTDTPTETPTPAL